MNQDQFFSFINQRLEQILPPGFSDLKEDVERNVKSAVKEGLSKMNVVTREEFEIQTAVLAKTRNKVEALEKQVKELESTLKALEK